MSLISGPILQNIHGGGVQIEETVFFYKSLMWNFSKETRVF